MFTTFKRWTLKDGFLESEVAALDIHFDRPRWVDHGE